MHMITYIYMHDNMYLHDMCIFQTLYTFACIAYEST